MIVGAKLSAQHESEQLRLANVALQTENESYRTATGELTSQIQSLEGVIDDLGARSRLDPAAARAMSKLPPAVRQRATGGPVETTALASASSVFSTSIASPEDTFGALRDLRPPRTRGGERSRARPRPAFGHEAVRRRDGRPRGAAAAACTRVPSCRRRAEPGAGGSFRGASDR